MKKGFVLDLNKCIGCQACSVACQIENHGRQHVTWREISTFNVARHPSIPLFHFSLACNHCDEAPCLRFCPALAYKRHSEFDTVIHDEGNCIGCTYCTWTCPYDAPKFSQSTGVVEKCDFCLSRLEKGLDPACVNLCPTGALQFQKFERRPQNITGFIEKEIRPGINIIPLRRNAGPLMSQKLNANEETEFNKRLETPPSKIDLKKESVLVIFTLLSAFLFSLAAAPLFRELAVNPLLFAGLGLLGMILSSLHLGRKLSAWRAILNFRRSWLSREIVFFTLFIASGTTAFMFPDIRGIGSFSAFLGLAALIAMDCAYHITEKLTSVRIHSASVLLTGLLFTSLFIENTVAISLLLSIKAVLYSYRKIHYIKSGERFSGAMVALRVMVGFAVPIGLIFIARPEFWLITTVIIFAEILDRIEFYRELKIITPKIQIAEDLKFIHASKRPLR